MARHFAKGFAKKSKDLLRFRPTWMSFTSTDRNPVAFDEEKRTRFGTGHFLRVRAQEGSKVQVFDSSISLTLDLNILRIFSEKREYRI